MKLTKVIFTYLWLAPLVFGIMTLASYEKDIDDVNFGFPETFYSKSYGMILKTGQMGASVSFRIDEFLRDVGWALLITLIGVFIYARLKKGK